MGKHKLTDRENLRAEVFRNKLKARAARVGRASMLREISRRAILPTGSASGQAVEGDGNDQVVGPRVGESAPTNTEEPIQDGALTREPAAGNVDAESVIDPALRDNYPIPPVPDRPPPSPRPRPLALFEPDGDDGPVDSDSSESTVDGDKSQARPLAPSPTGRREQPVLSFVGWDQMGRILLGKIPELSLYEATNNVGENLLDWSQEGENVKLPRLSIEDGAANSVCLLQWGKASFYGDWVELQWGERFAFVEIQIKRIPCADEALMESCGIDYRQAWLTVVGIGSTDSDTGSDSDATTGKEASSDQTKPDGKCNGKRKAVADISPNNTSRLRLSPNFDSTETRGETTQGDGDLMEVDNPGAAVAETETGTHHASGSSTTDQTRLSPALGSPDTNEPAPSISEETQPMEVAQAPRPALLETFREKWSCMECGNTFCLARRFNCKICNDGNFNLCGYCQRQGMHCGNPPHALTEYLPPHAFRGEIPSPPSSDEEIRSPEMHDDSSKDTANQTEEQPNPSALPASSSISPEDKAKSGCNTVQVQRLKAPALPEIRSTIWTCGECGEDFRLVHRFHCNICYGDYNICLPCYKKGATCYEDQTHTLAEYIPSPQTILTARLGTLSTRPAEELENLEEEAGRLWSCAVAGTRKIPSSGPAGESARVSRQFNPPFGSRDPAPYPDLDSNSELSSEFSYSADSSDISDSSESDVPRAQQEEAARASRDMNWRRLTEKDAEYVELIKQSSIYVVRLVAVSARDIDEDGFFDQKPGQINHLTGPNGNRRESAQLLAMGGWLAFSEEERARNPAKDTEGNGGRAALKARPLKADPIQFPADKPGLNYGPEPRLAGEEVPFWRAAVDPCKEDVYWMAYQLACGVQYSGFRRGAGFRGIWEFHKTDGDRNLLDQCPFDSPSKMVARLQAPPRCSGDI